MPKICLISPLPPPGGGIAQWTLNVLDTTRSRADISIVHTDSSHTRANVLSASKLSKVIGGVGVILRVMPRYFRVLLSGVDVTHLTTSGYIGAIRDLLVLLISKIWFKPVVYHLHFGRLPELAVRGGWEWRLLCACISLSAHVIVLDSQTLSCVKSKFRNKHVSFIPNPIKISSIEAECDFPRSEFDNLSGTRYVLYLGWLLPTKGIEDLIRAWSQVQHDGTHLVLAGPCLDEYRNYIKPLVEDQSVVLLGEVSHRDAMQLLKGASFLVLPSHTEAFPNVLLEAMALSKPAIATSVGAIPNILSDNCGLIVPPQNIDALADALSALMFDESLRKTMGRNGRRKCEDFYDANVVVDSYVNLWASVAAA